jgi:AP-1-like factor
MFNFDMASLSTWPTTTPQQDGFLDDIFSGYMTGTPMDLSMQSNSPASISPVAHHLTPASSHVRSPLNNGVSSSSSSSPSIIGSSNFLTPRDTPPTDRDSPTIVHSSDTCPKNKQELEQRIHQEGPSPFAPATLRKSSDSVLGTMISCAGTSFPKTAKSDQNIEVLSAWRSIRSDPKFKVCFSSLAIKIHSI